jgi:hypothetical protein
MNAIFRLFFFSFLFLLLLFPKGKNIRGMLSRGDTSRDNLYKIDMGVVKPLKQTKKGGGGSKNR